MTFIEAHDKLHEKYGEVKIGGSIELSTLHEYLRNKIQYEGEGDTELSKDNTSEYLYALITKYLP